MRIRTWMMALGALAILATGCGSDGDGADEASTPTAKAADATTVPSTATPTTTTTASASESDLACPTEDEIRATATFKADRKLTLKDTSTPMQGGGMSHRCYYAGAAILTFQRYPSAKDAGVNFQVNSGSRMQGAREIDIPGDKAVFVPNGTTSANIEVLRGADYLSVTYYPDATPGANLEAGARALFKLLEQRKKG